MKFDSNRSWRDAAALLKRDRQLVWPVAGVFFLLPSIASSLLLGDVQERFAKALGDEAAMTRLVEAYGSRMALVSTASLMVQALGLLSLAVLMASRERPTVGSAIAGGFRALPSLVAATLLVAIGYLLLSVLGGMFGVGAAQVLAMPLLALMIYALVRFSPTLPVIAIEGLRNPVTALARAWRLTRGNAGRLLIYFLLLVVVYFVVSLLATVIVAGPFLAVLGPDELGLFIAAVVSGVVGAGAGAALAAILVSNWRQLASAIEAGPA